MSDAPAWTIWPSHVPIGRSWRNGSVASTNSVSQTEELLTRLMGQGCRFVTPTTSPSSSSLHRGSRRARQPFSGGAWRDGGVTGSPKAGDEDDVIRQVSVVC